MSLCRLQGCEGSRQIRSGRCERHLADMRRMRCAAPKGPAYLAFKFVRIARCGFTATSTPRGTHFAPRWKDCGRSRRTQIETKPNLALTIIHTFAFDPWSECHVPPLPQISHKSRPRHLRVVLWNCHFVGAADWRNRMRGVAAQIANYSAIAGIFAHSPRGRGVFRLRPSAARNGR